jgi:MFS family permease
MSSQPELWQILRSAKLVEGDEPRDNEPHWANRFMLGVVGWLAALFLLFFLFLSVGDLIDSPDHALALGATLLAMALLLNRSARSGDLWDQFVLALTLAADAWLLYGLIDRMDVHAFGAWAGLSALAFAIAFCFEHWLIRLFHTLAAALLLTLALACLGLQILALPLVMALLCACWLWAQRRPHQHERFEAMAFGLALSLILLGRLHQPLFDETSVLEELGRSRLPHWLNPLLCAALLLALLHHLKLPRRQGLFALPLVLLAALIPGMGAGALVLLLGFYAGSLGMMTLAALLLLGFGSLYYYDLALPLMTKSWLLLGSGTALLLVRALLLRLGRHS